MPDPQQDWFASNAPKATAPAGGDWFASNAGTSKTAPAGDSSHPASRFAEEFWKRASPLSWAEGLIEAAKHPVDTAVNMVRSDPEFLTQAKEAAHKGDYLTAGRKVLSYLSMGLGHELDTQADMMQRGDVAGGVGAMTGMTTQFLAPEATMRGVAAVAPKTIRVAPTPQPSPQLAAAVALAEREGIPLDAATATGSDLIRSVQKKVGDSMGGAGTAERLKNAQSDRLATVGDQLAAKANAAPMAGPLQPGAARPMVPGVSVSPEQAGTFTRNSVGNVVQSQGAAADTAYSALRAIEAKTPIPVDLTQVKAAIEPIYATMAKGADIAPLQGSKASAVRAMARILEGPDVADASVVDSALSDLKALQRDANGTPGAGAANAAVSQVHQAVLQAVAKAGPDAVKALNEGRAATTAKYAAQDVLESLNEEPVRATKQLTERGDSSLNKLRDVAQQAPEAIPQIARSVLDGLMDQATQDGGFGHAQAVRSKWLKLGPGTKQLLFKDPSYIADIDNFLYLAQKMAENPNPSGTARINNLFNATSAAVGYPLSKLLYTKQGVQLLRQGLTLPTASSAAVAVWRARLAKFGAVNGLVQTQQPASVTPAG